MDKFKVGDIITGTDQNPYVFTDWSAIMKVVGESQGDSVRASDMRVRILNHKTTTTQIGREYDVHSSYFKLLESARPLTQDEVEQLYAEATYWG